MAIDPYKIATWRWEQISFLEDEALTPADRNVLLAQKTKQPVLWPSGAMKPIPRSTLYGWWKAYRDGGKKFETLLPCRRKDYGTPRTDRSEWIQKAIYLLWERPERTLNFLLLVLATYFPNLVLKRPTLHREIQAHPLWPFIRRQRKGAKGHRVRFQADEPHDIWYLDAKGAFTVRFQSGEEKRLVVLTVLDDHTRAVLAVTIAESEDLGAAVRVFRDAIARWGLPNKIYADRHSVYDSDAFRTGLAQLGIHRINTKAGDPPPRGKIEAYHRFLKAWFVRELVHQVIVDLAHLLELLVALIAIAYQPHYHREIKASPEEALANRCSSRHVSLDALRRTFWVRKQLTAHPITGELDLPAGKYCVPASYAGQEVNVRYDPAEPDRVVLIGRDGQEISLQPAFHKELKPEKPQTSRRGPGVLQRLLDVYRGRSLPVSIPGFGFPEFCEALANAINRPVAQTEEEAAYIQDFYRDKGPFAPDAFAEALKTTIAALGPERPVKAYLDYIDRLIVPATTTSDAKETQK